LWFFVGGATYKYCYLFIYLRPTIVQSATSGSSQIAIRRLASRAQKRVATLSGLRGQATVAVLPRVVAGHWNRPFALSVTSFGHVSTGHSIYVDRRC